MKIGDRFTFVPSGFFGEESSKAAHCSREVTGTIVEINAEKAWFRVKAEINGITLFETFKYVPTARAAHF